MQMHLISVVVVALVLAVPASAAARTRDAERFAALAAAGRASGTLHFAMRFENDPDTCVQSDTCGVSGTVTARLRLDSRRRLRVRGDLVALPVRGTATARARDLVAGRQCREKVARRSAGLLFVGDAHGLLLRAGAARARSGVEDPFATGCPAPDLTSFGTSALPSIRLRTVRPNINRLRLTIRARRTVTAHGITATITTSARLVLKR